MNDYKEVRISPHPCDTTTTDILAALLAEIGYESFVPDADGVTAYIKDADFDRQRLNEALEQFPMPGHTFGIKSETIEGRDWNKEWERNYFRPIVVDNRCCIHSSFHTDYPGCEYDIVIDPKMAFGTGHHSTTSLIIRRLLGMDLKGLAVIDMGTGTGILAILAAMRGATPVSGIEIDPAAFANAKENILLNHHPEIRLVEGDATSLNTLPKADILIANINRNIILSDMGRYAEALKPEGSVLLSGFYEEDVNMVLQRAQEFKLEFMRQAVDNRWCMLELKLMPGL